MGASWVETSVGPRDTPFARIDRTRDRRFKVSVVDYQYPGVKGQLCDHVTDGAITLFGWTALRRARLLLRQYLAKVARPDPVIIITPEDLD
jgi:hypothetical protein